MAFVPFQAVQRVGSDYWYHVCCDMHSLPHRANRWDWKIADRGEDWVELEFQMDDDWLARADLKEFRLDPRPTLTTQDVFWNRIQRMQKCWLDRSSWIKARLNLRAQGTNFKNRWRLDFFLIQELRPGLQYAFRMHKGPKLRGEVVIGEYHGVDCPLCVNFSPPAKLANMWRKRELRWSDYLQGGFNFIVKTDLGKRLVWSRNLESITGT